MRLENRVEGVNDVTCALPTVSVIVPAHGTEEYLFHCLESLKNQKVKPLEIIVSLDGNDYRLAELGRRYGANVLVNHGQCGPAIVRNRGAAVARGDILLFIDADTVIPPIAVETVAAKFADDVGMVAMFGSYDDAPADPGFFSQYRNLLHHYVHQNSNSQAKTFWAGCGAIRRKAFEEFGGFNERYHRPAAEDIELGYRLTEAGRKILLCKALQVKHLKRWTWYSTLQTDLLIRSLSWSRLLIEAKGRYVNDLNMNWRFRYSIATSLCLMVFLLSALLVGNSLFPGMAMIFVVWFWLNRGVLRFYSQTRSIWFSMRVIPALWLHYVCGGLGYMLAWTEWLTQNHRINIQNLNTLGLNQAEVMIYET